MRKVASTATAPRPAIRTSLPTPARGSP
jgi:hypothetical protein